MPTAEAQQPAFSRRPPWGLLLLAGACLNGGEDRVDAAPSHTAPEVIASDARATTVVPGEQTPHDWLIQGGTVVDGTGVPGYRADLLLTGGQIRWVGDRAPDGLVIRDTLDATGLLVTPGFLDAHAHGDPLETPAFANFLAMGVTTIVLGQDGSSPTAREMEGHLAAVDRVRPGVNVAYLAGHNTLRLEAGVGYGNPDAQGLERLSERVAAAMDAGAVGLSLGLEYDPGVRTGMDELVAVARSVAERGGVVMSHMRNEDADAVEASLEELVEQGRRSGARVHASHLKVVLGSDLRQAERMLSSMVEARSDGVEVTGDVYPYTASFTGLAILFPEWARPPHDYARVADSRRHELLDHLRARVESRNGPEATLFGAGPYTGETLGEVSRSRGRPFEEILLELGPGGARAAYFVMDEAVMATFLAHPLVAVASDGGPTMAHPRGYGTFPTVLGKWARDLGHLSVEEAIRKMTSLPASILGLDRPGAPSDPGPGEAGSVPTDPSDPAALPRGRIHPGWAADLAIFRLHEVEATADFTAPHRLARGMRAVFVAGEPALLDGTPVKGVRWGRALRHRAAVE